MRAGALSSILSEGREVFAEKADVCCFEQFWHLCRVHHARAWNPANRLVQVIETPMSTLPTFSNPAERPTAILCIDDERPTLLVRTAQLETAGYRVFPASTANVAVELFVAHQIDLILSAMVLPGGSGADLSIFMRHVRPEVPLVLLARTDRLHRTLLKQVDACIERDASENDLITCLRQVLVKQFSRTRTLQCGEMRGTQ